MSSTKGPPFTSPPIPPILCKWAAELNSAHPATWLPSGPSLGLVHRFFEETGRGTYVADGCSIAHGTRVAAYWGELTLHSTPTSLYSLELPTVRRNSRSYVPFVDASNHCQRGVTPTSHAGLSNHACEDPPHAQRPGSGCHSAPSISWSARLAAPYAGAPSSRTIMTPTTPSAPSLLAPRRPPPWRPLASPTGLVAAVTRPNAPRQRFIPRQ